MPAGVFGPVLGAPFSTADANTFTGVQTFNAQVQWSKGADVASATALPILTDGNYFDVTGTTTITSIVTTGHVGTVVKLHFDAILTLTNSAADLILPGGANITTAAGDEAEFVEYASGDYRCTAYTKASGEAVVSGGGGGAWTFISEVTASASSTVDFTSGIDSTFDQYMIAISEMHIASNGQDLLVRVGDSTAIKTDSNYQFHATKTSSGGTSYSAVALTGASSITVAELLSNTSATRSSINLFFDISNKANLWWIGAAVSATATNVVSLHGGGNYEATLAMERIQFRSSSGTITLGTFRLYGLAKS